MYMWERLFLGPWYLDLGISSKVFNPSFESLVLVLNGFGSWFEQGLRL